MQESRESRIEQKIEDIYSFVESCKMQRLSATRVIVPKDELYDLLDDLRRDIPAEIKRYRKILNQRDAILDDANTKAQAMLADAKEQYKALVEEHNIMQQAYQQAEKTVNEANQRAQEILDDARKQAEEIGSGAIYYTSDLLTMAEKTIQAAYTNTLNNSKALEKSLKEYLDTVRNNKAELVVDQSRSGSPESEQGSESAVRRAGSSEDEE